MDRITHFEAQRIAGAQTRRHHRVGGEKQIPQLVGVLRVEIDLKAQFAGAAGPADDAADAVQIGQRPMEMAGQVRKFHPQLQQHVGGARPLQVEHRDIGGKVVKFRAALRQALPDPVGVGEGVARVDHQEQVVVRHPERQQVVPHAAVVI